MIERGKNPRTPTPSDPTPSDPTPSDPTPSDPTPSDTEDELGAELLREVAWAPMALPSPIALAGKTLGRYRVHDRLGRGGMGVVYAAEDERLRRQVALKILPPHLTADPRRRRLLLREARSAAAAAHPGIAAVYDIEEIGEHIVIVMERVEGRTLRAVIAEASPQGLPAGEVARLGREIALALAHAHRAGVLHRDLKPDNVMVTPGGAIKILDFGIAKLRGACPGTAGEADTPSFTSGRELLGTPAYMAPEQAKGWTTDERADIFSVGVILYEMATAARPFMGASAAEVLISLDRDDPAAPSSRNASVAAPLERVILRCLQKHPEDRYASAEQLAAALLPVASASGEGIKVGEDDAGTGSERLPSGAAVSAIGTARPGSPRRRWAIGLAALAAALPIGLAAQRWRPGAAPASPLAAPASVLACPPLHASGVAEPAGWLGAAAAFEACRRARALLGGAAARTLVPAALLDLPRLPSEEVPPDPYAGARLRALDAARARADATLDGSVTHDRGTFVVRLDLLDREGRALGRGEGRSGALHLAVREAMAPLVRPDALPRAAAVDPAIATWSGIRDVDLLLGVQDWETASLDSLRVSDAEIDRLAPRKAELGARWISIMADRASYHGEGWDDLPAPPVDRSSPAAFALSAPVHALLDPHADPAALAEEARALAVDEPSPIGRAALAWTEAQLRDRSGDAARATALLLNSIQFDPTGPGLNLLAIVAGGRESRIPDARAYAAWAPDDPNAWAVLSNVEKSGDAAGRIARRRRAYEVSGRAPFFATQLSIALLAEGRREEVRALSAEMLAAASPAVGRVDPHLIAGELMLAQLDASEARFGAALARARRVLGALPSFGRLSTSEWMLQSLQIALSLILDRAQEIGDEFVEHFMDAEPVRVVPGRFVPGYVATACAFASPPAARRCFGRLRGLIASGYFRERVPDARVALVGGAEAYARGDWAAAAAALRPFADGAAAGRHFVPMAFDRAGEHDLAERIDGDAADGGGPYRGVGLAHLRSARRALARGDRARAEALARRIVEAWSVADVAVPAVAELRVLLPRSPGAKGRGGAR